MAIHVRIKEWVDREHLERLEDKLRDFLQEGGGV